MMLRTLLVFLVGLLVGANAAYFYAKATLECATPTAAAPRVVAPVAVVETPSASMAPHAATPTVATPIRTPAPTPGGLVIPVQGIAASALVDTYTQARGEGRVHEAIDIMAAEGTPVIAAVDGPVVKLFTSDRGGLTIYQFDVAGRRVYYYAHLSRYADGLAEGQVAKQGQVIGFVGHTGDASPEAPHLHFTVGDLGAEKQWWKSTPVNPYPLLTGAAR